MISFHQQVLVRSGEVEKTWLDEAMSHSGNTGAGFTTLAAEWLPASLLDDEPDFVGVSPRMRFKSWALRGIRTNPAGAQICRDGFPLKPDSTSGGYSHSGTLRGGWGRHLRLIQHLTVRRSLCR